MSAESQDLESLMEEYSTVPNYRDIPTNIIPPYLTVQLWKHQYQAIYAALEAEHKGPVINDKGEAFYSRSGIICLGTGTGKTMIMLGVSNFGVDKPSIENNIAATSLNTILLNKVPRENIPCTLICCDKKILNNAWIPDLKKGYPGIPYHIFDTVGSFKEDVKKCQEYQYYNIETQKIKMYINEWCTMLHNNVKTQAEFEIALSTLGDIRSESDAKIFFNQLDRKLENKLQELINKTLVNILKSVKIFIVTKDSFYFLFDLFKDYTVSRLILDEPQSTTLTHQKMFREYIKDERMKKLRSNGLGRMLPFYEESPARFIWYVSATPHLIAENNDDHYFNSWISKNDYVISDYSSNKEEERLFPELSSRYVIKFPYSYILESRPEFKALINEYVLKCKKKVEVTILRGALGDEFDQMLENDDFEGLISKLNVGGEVTNVLDAAVRRLQIEIDKHRHKINSYDDNTPKHVIEQSKAKLEEEINNLKEIERKINRYRGISTQSSNEDCPICFESLHIIPQAGDEPDKRCIIHMGCMNVFHIGCMKTVFLSNKTCPMCIGNLIESEIKLTCDNNNQSVEMQVINEENHQRQINNHQNMNVILDVNKEYEDKMEALKACLGPMVRNGQVYPRRKILLFVDFSKDESAKIKEIIHLIQDAGFNVRLPFKVGTIDALNRAYPPRNGMIVKQAGASTSITKEIEKFREDSQPYVWIFRSNKESAGLNFPFVDTSIEFSKFKSHMQIRGRSKRYNRVVPVDLIRLDYV